VQGVGFRFSAAKEAERLQLSGFARNRHDGTVELEAEGTDAAIETFEQWLKVGPRGARVDGVAARELEPQGSSGFDIRA
jgi:acylphosphatase